MLALYKKVCIALLFRRCTFEEAVGIPSQKISSKIGLYQQIGVYSMKALKSVTLAMFALSLCPLVGQTNPSMSRPAPGRRHQACWMQAGISRSAMQQRREIAESARSQMESVCSDSGLTLQQKRRQIRQIHEQAKTQLSGVITPEQQQAFESCRMTRRERRGLLPEERGLCGGMAPNRRGPGARQQAPPSPGPGQN